MLRFLDVKGREVFFSNRKIGFLEDIIVDCKNKKIALYVVNPTNEKGFYYVRINDVTFEEDNIVLNNKCYKVNNIKNKCLQKYLLTRILGANVRDDNSKEYGSLADVIFDEKTGRIRALVISLGIFDDLVNGRRVVLLDNEDILDSEETIVKNTSLEIINEISIV
jgi:uncharacterized protein YrrD